jgi:hypothetical protein
VDNKPRTTVTITATGTKRFQVYLDTLGEVLKRAKSAMRREPAGGNMPAARLATT